MRVCQNRHTLMKESSKNGPSRMRLTSSRHPINMVFCLNNHEKAIHILVALS